jgi:hypothetical protein
MEYFKASGVGTAVLMWQPPGEAKQVVPTSNLTPHRNNNPPSLAPIPQFTAARNELVTFTASATDVDSPVQSLIFSLDAGAPAGASINPISGAFSWTPSSSQPPGPSPITVRVSDTGAPEMSDAQTFTVTVLTNAASVSCLRSTNGICVTWPEAAGPLRLYSTTNLAPPVTWYLLNVTPALSNGQWSVQILSTTNTVQFFRLQNP